jgi:hypothetical protein
VVALGIDTDGVKHPLGLWDGSTANATVVTTLLANLVERGLDLEHLPERDRPLARRRLRAAWTLDDHDRALVDQLPMQHGRVHVRVVGRARLDVRAKRLQATRGPLATLPGPSRAR